jgi:threonine 3-dehydrogenase
MNVLITGGTGVIGAEIARLLLGREGVKPVAFDFNPSSQRLGDSAKQVHILRGDLGIFSDVLNAVKATRPEVIYHLGGMLSLPAEADPPAALRANVLGTFHVLEAARLFDVRQVLFASSLATYGLDLQARVITDYTLQRPELFYGATKLFGELMGRFYRRKYGLDFRGLRYPAIVGPGVKTPGVVQYNSWVVEECAKGKPYTIKATPETAVPVLYVKDAARALVQLGEAPRDAIRTVVYLLAGVTPTPSARELADIVRAKVPGAAITFTPDPAVQGVLDQLSLPVDDSCARTEWNWRPAYTQEQMVDDFLKELRLHPQRYV